ncbi:hypothetical protein, partial [Proteus mirabilis]|uniref:hypothetical protein n=1 Tax=Proteus mirabilis TaxID=584 RepID=UPI0015C56C59
MELEENFEEALEENLHGKEEKDPLEDEEIHKPIDTSSSMLLLFEPPIDPFWPLPSFYFVLF